MFSKIIAAIAALSAVDAVKVETKKVKVEKVQSAGAAADAIADSLNLSGMNFFQLISNPKFQAFANACDGKVDDPCGALEAMGGNLVEFCGNLGCDTQSGV